MNVVDAVILGIVEGFTEFLPVSSTAHLIIASRILRLEENDFLKSFAIAIQLGAILSVVLLYRRTFIKNMRANSLILTAFIPTALIGFALYSFIKDILLESIGTVATALLVGGMLLIIFEKCHKEKENAAESITDIPYRKAFIIGCAQALAVIPGVSRAAATILGGMLLNIKRKTITEFSFLLAVPTMCAATGYDLLRSAGSFDADQIHLLVIGFAVSFIFAAAGIKFFMNFIKTHSFISFGVYRMCAGILILAFILL